MTPSQKQALQFAYDLLSGKLRDERLPYIHVLVPGSIREESRSADWQWIAPDRDPQRPFLNEATLTELVMRGYFECVEFKPGPFWMYRITPEGAAALGREWVLLPPKAVEINAQHAPERKPPVHRRKQKPLDPPEAEVDPHRLRRSADWRRR